MPPEERRRRADGIAAYVREHDIEAWIDAQLADLDRRGHARIAVVTALAVGKAMGASPTSTSPRAPSRWWTWAGSRSRGGAHLRAGRFGWRRRPRGGLRELPKGDALATAQLAGIMAAKRTSELIPLCHPLPLSHVEVELEVGDGGVEIIASAETTAQTGVEMEALTAVSVAALTVYDMAKAIDKEMAITDVTLIEKTKAEV